MMKLKWIGVAAMMAAGSALAGTVTISDGSTTMVGTTSASATMEANGNITITGFTWSSGCLGNDCGGGGGGGETPPPVVTAPVCSIAPLTAVSFTGSGSATLSASCSNTPTSYSWKVGSANGSEVGTSQTFSTGTLTASATYYLTASNSAGTSSAASQTVTITPADSGGSTSCANRPPLSNAATASTTKMQLFTRPTGIFFDSIGKATVQPYSLRNSGMLNGSGKIDVIATGAFVKVWISACPGEDHANVPLDCKKTKASTLRSISISSDGSSGCNIGTNQDMFLNIENTSSDSAAGVQAAVYNN